MELVHVHGLDVGYSGMRMGQPRISSATTSSAPWIDIRAGPRTPPPPAKPLTDALVVIVVAADRAAGSLASSSPLAWTARSRSCSGWQAVGFGAAELDDQRPERLSAHDRCGGVAVESAGGQTQPAAALGSRLSAAERPVMPNSERCLSARLCTDRNVYLASTTDQPSAKAGSSRRCFIYKDKLLTRRISPPSPNWPRSYADHSALDIDWFSVGYIKNYEFLSD
jgi:hypothetical protein